MQAQTTTPGNGVKYVEAVLIDPRLRVLVIAARSTVLILADMGIAWRRAMVILADGLGDYCGLDRSPR